MKMTNNKNNTANAIKTETAEEMAIVSPYNTYLNAGFPIGPICNPGEAAISAALYPNEEYLAEHYLFFCNANPNLTSALLFSKTYEEHAKYGKIYAEYLNQRNIMK